MPRQQSSISTIILCHKSEAWLADCLDSISRQSLPPCRVCCDFDGRDHAAESIASAHPVVSEMVCRESKSGGPAMPQNQGWQLLQSSADYPTHDVRQPEIAAGVAVGKSFAIDTKEREHRRVQVVHVDLVLDGVEAVLVGRAERKAISSDTRKRFQSYFAATAAA